MFVALGRIVEERLQRVPKSLAPRLLSGRVRGDSTRRWLASSSICIDAPSGSLRVLAQCGRLRQRSAMTHEAGLST